MQTKDNLTAMNDEVLVISDIHVHNYKAFDKNGSRLENCLRVIDDTFALAKSRKIHTVLMVGDLYDQQKSLPTVVVNSVIHRLKANFEKYENIRWVCITGNHDQASKNLLGKSGVSALSHLADAFPEHFFLIDNTYATLQGVGKSQHVIYGVPYYEYAEHFKAALTELCLDAEQRKHFPNMASCTLMIHQTPTGLSNVNIPPDTAYDDSEYMVFDMTLCGHIHKRQVMSRTFQIVGSPLHRDLGDAGQRKGVLIYNLGTKETEFVDWTDNYPVYMSIEEGEEPVDGEYAIVKHRNVALNFEEQDVADNFAADLGAKELLTNYVNHTTDKREGLLEVGLSFLQ